jgi:hypothetical protein
MSSTDVVVEPELDCVCAADQKLDVDHKLDGDKNNPIELSFFREIQKHEVKPDERAMTELVLESNGLVNTESFMSSASPSIRNNLQNVKRTLNRLMGLTDVVGDYRPEAERTIQDAPEILFGGFIPDTFEEEEEEEDEDEYEEEEFDDDESDKASESDSECSDDDTVDGVASVLYSGDDTCEDDSKYENCRVEIKLRPETYKARSPQLHKSRTIDESSVWALHYKPFDFLNIMRQTNQLSYKFVFSKERGDTGWVAILYVTWHKHKYSLASHFHLTKKESKHSVVDAFQKMAVSYLSDRSFANIDSLVAFYVFARVPDSTSIFDGVIAAL